MTGGKAGPLPGESGMVRRAGLAFLALVSWNIGNYAFFLVAGRALGPSDYGLVAALLGATVAVSIPAQGLQFAVARLVAAPPDGDASRADAVYAHAWARCLPITTGVAIAATACMAIAAAVSSVPAGPMLAALTIVLPMGWLFLALGRLQGQERFVPFSIGFGLLGVPRPILLVILLAVMSGVYASLAATLAVTAVAAGYAAGRAGLPSARRPEPASPDDRGRFSRALLPVVVGLSGIGLLTNLDVVVARLWLDPVDSGRFAAAAVLAKAILLVPQALAFILLPRTAARSARGDHGAEGLALGVLITLGAGAVVAALATVLAEPVIDLTFGGEYTDAANLLAPYLVASTLLGALILLVNHHIGRGRDGFVWSMAALAVVEMALLAIFHDDATQIVSVLIAVPMLGIAMHEVMTAGSSDSIVRALAARIGL